MKTVPMYTNKIIRFRKCFKNKNYHYVHFADLHHYLHFTGKFFNKCANSVIIINFIYIYMWYIHKSKKLS